MASSDIDFPSPVRPSWQKINAGGRSIDIILQNANEDRYSSKQVSKQLQDNAGTPGVLRDRYIWSRRFEVFRKESLDAESVPSTASSLPYFQSLLSTPLIYLPL